MVDEVVVDWRLDNGTEVTRPWLAVGSDELALAAPWRTFRWYKGQKHYSGVYWSATTRTHVPYESRLELTRLLCADFDTATTAIVAQPFLLRAVVDGKQRKHVPDYLLLRDDGPVVVDVKPRARLDEPKVSFTLDWTRQVVSSRGWRYEVSSEVAEPRLSNIRFLSGYRRGRMFDPELLEQLQVAGLNGLTLDQAVRSQRSRDPATVRPALFHLLWRQVYTVDLSRTLTPQHVIGEGS